MLATVHRAQGDLATLTGLAEQRAATAPTADERAAAWLEVARLAEELDHTTEAAAAYTRMLADAPGDVVALEARAQLAFRAGDWEVADLHYAAVPAAESNLGSDELLLRRSIVATEV